MEEIRTVLLVHYMEALAISNICTTTTTTTTTTNNNNNNNNIQFEVFEYISIQILKIPIQTPLTYELMFTSFSGNTDSRIVEDTTLQWKVMV